MKKVLCITNTMNSGGAETFLMKIYRKIDRSKYQMDFCVNVEEECFYAKEIRNLGGKIFFVPPKSKNVKAFKKQLAALIKKEKYEYVFRITSNAAGFMDLKIAKKAGAKRCSARSSNSSDGASRAVKLIHRISRLLYGRYVDVKIAPSDLAARYTFGDRAYRSGEVNILHNAVDLSIFKFSAEDRNLIRTELNIPTEKIVIGHIGRFMAQKNHSFLLDIFAKIKAKNSNALLMLVGGNGDLKDAVTEKIKALNLEDSVIFTGIRSDIPRLLSAMDVFVMPSFFEGMPNTVIEAQATGLPCVISDTITREANITGLVAYLPLSEPNVWAEKALGAIKEQRQDTKQIFIDQKYDIESTVDNFVKLVFGEDK